MSVTNPEPGEPGYPYWIDQFNKEYKGYELWFYEKKEHKNKPSKHDTADAYRVFMIACNNFCGLDYSENSRLDIVKMLKNADEEHPLEINGEFFYSVKD